MDEKNEIKEYHKKWEKNNPEKLKAYRKRNSEKKKLYQHQWYLDNKEKCLQNSKDWAILNHQSIRELAKKRHQKKIQWMLDYKLSKGCAICGYNKCAYALDFHHDGDKEFDISIAVAGNRSINEVKKEMEKCIVLCSNCHRELHYGQ